MQSETTTIYQPWINITYPVYYIIMLVLGAELYLFFPSPSPTNIRYIIDEGVVFEKVYRRQQNSLVQVFFTKGLWQEPLLGILTDHVAAFRFLDTEDTLPDNCENCRLEEI